MSVLSSYTLLSRAPLPPAGEFSLPAAAATASLPRVPVLSRRRTSSRAPLIVCRDHKNSCSIQHNALVNRGSTISGGDWSIVEDNDHINLKFRVGELTSTDKVVIHVTEELELLIKDESPASKLDVQLKMPPGYDYEAKKVMKAIILPGPGGWLQVTIAKPKLEANQNQLHVTQ